MNNTAHRLVLAVSVLAGAALAAASSDFISTWKAPGVAPMNFAGRKVAAVLIVDDDNLRVSAEEALAHEISARGPVGTPAYRIIPKEELKNPDAAKPWFEKAGIAGLVIMRLVETDTTKVYSSAIWSGVSYGHAWNYWDYGWANVYPIGKARLQRTITVETLLYDLTSGSPLWAGVSRTTDPKNVQTYMTLLAVDIVKELEKDGLVRTRPR